MNQSSQGLHKSAAGIELHSDNLDKTSGRFLSSPLAVIFLTVFIDLVGFGIVIPILPYYVEAFGGTPFEVGMLFASYSVMQFIFAPVWGGLSDKYGRRPILFWSLIGTSAGFLVLGLANALWLVFLGRILSGIMGANISTAQAYIADVTTPENRAKGMGLIGAAFGLGFVFGPAIGGILSGYGSHVPFYFAGFLALANAVLLFFVLPETVKPNQSKFKPQRNRFSVLFGAFGNSKFALITLLYFLAITAFSIMTTAFSLYTAYRFGYDATHNGYLFAYIGILSVIMQGGLIGILSKKIGETRLVTIGCFILVFSFFFVPLVSPDTFAGVSTFARQISQTYNFWLPAHTGGLLALLLGVAAFSLGNSISTPSLTSLGSKFAPANEQGATLGVLQSAASLARAVGPMLAGILLYSATAPTNIDNYTIFRTFWTASGVMLVAFLVSLYFLRVNTQNDLP